MKNLEKEIERSKYIYDLKDNWDDEGSKGYSKETWDKTIHFIRNWSKWLIDNNLEVNAPNILHGLEGGIDIFWTSKLETILLRIWDDVSKGCYFAMYESGEECGGQFDIENGVTDFSELPFSKL